jgi:hypothetical protein
MSSRSGGGGGGGGGGFGGDQGPGDSPRVSISRLARLDSPRTLVIQSGGGGAGWGPGGRGGGGGDGAGEEDSARTNVYCASSARGVTCRSHIRASRVRRSILAPYMCVVQQAAGWRRAHPRHSLRRHSAAAGSGPPGALHPSQRSGQSVQMATGLSQYQCLLGPDDGDAYRSVMQCDARHDGRVTVKRSCA